MLYFPLFIINKQQMRPIFISKVILPSLKPWLFTSKTSINRIVKAQKKAIRIITQSHYNEHIAPLFVSLEILPYDKILEQSKLTFMHSIEYNYAPRAFANTWFKNADHNIGHALRNDNDYATTFTQTWNV